MRIENGIYIYKAEGIEIRTPYRCALKERKQYIRALRMMEKMGLVFTLIKMNNHGKVTMDIVNKVILVEIESDCIQRAKEKQFDSKTA
jgi:hypothetical protein